MPHRAERLIPYIDRPIVRTWTVTTEHRVPRVGERYVTERYAGGFLVLAQSAPCDVTQDVIVKVEATS